MSKKIIFSNQKGGVGKTTVCRELGISLAQAGHRVLFVDCDPQGNLTKSISEDGEGLYEALMGENPSPCEISENLSLLKGNIRLSLLEKNLLGEIDAYSRLTDYLESNSLFINFDFILFDTPPSLGILTVNALAAADYLVVPVSCRLYSMQGTNDLMATVSKVRKNLNPDIRLLGVVINNFDRVPVISRQIKAEIEDAFGEVVFESVLSKSIRIEEAIASKSGVSQMGDAVGGRVKEELLSLTQELLGRC